MYIQDFRFVGVRVTAGGEQINWIKDVYRSRLTTLAENDCVKRQL